MRIETDGEVVAFKPVKVTFTLESQDEVDAFYRAGECVYREYPSGSDEENVGRQMKNAVENWKRNV